MNDDTDYRFNEISRHTMERALAHLRDDPNTSVTSYELRAIESLLGAIRCP